MRHLGLANVDVDWWLGLADVDSDVRHLGLADVDVDWRLGLADIDIERRLGWDEDIDADRGHWRHLHAGLRVYYISGTVRVCLMIGIVPYT